MIRSYPLGTLNSISQTTVTTVNDGFAIPAVCVNSRATVTIKVLNDNPGNYFNIGLFDGSVWYTMDPIQAGNMILRNLFQEEIIIPSWATRIALYSEYPIAVGTYSMELSVEDPS